jgi:hypothetical protein
MLKYTEKELRRAALEKYEAGIGPMTPEERKELHAWVSRGRSVYDNPEYLYTENGYPFDFITAIRIAEDMINNPEDYQ